MASVILMQATKALAVPGAGRGRLIAAAAFAALPWLNPIALGPSASVQPWLVAMACALALVIPTLRRGCGPPAGLVAASVATVAWAVLSRGSLSPEIVMLAGGLALIALAAAAARDPDTACGLQAGLLGAAVASAVFGLCQYFGAAQALWPWVSPAQAGEAYGNLRQPNQYASLCWIGAALLVFGRARLPFSARALGIVLLAVGSAASVSRTAMLQGLLLAFLAAWWPGPDRKRRAGLCALALVVYFAAAALLPLLLETMTGAMPARTLWARLGDSAGCASRLVLWSNVLHLIAQKPLAGWGWGELDYAHFMTLYAGPRFCDILDNAHNLPLHLAVELGVPAAFLILGGAALWAWRMRPWAEQEPVRQLAWAVLALLLLHSLFEYPLWYGPFQIAFGVAIGWLMPAAASPGGARRVHLPTVVAVAVLVPATAYAAWDYLRVSQIYLPPEQRLGAWSEDTLAHVRRSWLFSGQARFADLTLSPVQRANAQWVYAESADLLHYSPEPRIIERAIESATMLGREDEAVLMLARYRAAFPRDYRLWSGAQKRPPAALP
jgi:O-antigen ligase